MGRAARGDGGGFIDPVELTLKVLHKSIDLRSGRFRNALWRHLPSTQFRDDPIPSLPFWPYRGRIQELIDVEAARRKFVVMAPCAGLTQQRRYVFIESTSA